MNRHVFACWFDSDSKRTLIDLLSKGCPTVYTQIIRSASVVAYV